MQRYDFYFTLDIRRSSFLNYISRCFPSKPCSIQSFCVPLAIETQIDFMDNHYLHIYRASAGSGKTFTLAVAYICLLIERPDAYRHILAVTFTNKATAEMKNRILGKLYALANDTPDGVPYLKEVRERTNLPDATIRKRASKALSLLIHDYSHFRIATIDSFFQSVLRALARELDLGTGMTIELDTRKVIADAVNLLILELKPGDATLEWIETYIYEQMDEGKYWNITDELKKFAENIHREDFQRKAAALDQQLKIPNLIRDLRRQLTVQRKAAVDLLQERATQFFTLLSDNGYNVDDFSYQSSGACGYYLNIQKGKYSTTLSPRHLAGANGPEGWVSKSAANYKELTAFAATYLVPHINDTHDLCLKYVPEIYSCDLIMHHLYQLQLIDIIHDQVLRINREENRFLLADTCQMLSHMQTGDSAFVFEKLGYYIEHIMIDEFQDTSRMQWDNFYPLLLEGLSHGKSSLVVGDVKQAIYRWRGSDWRILNEELAKKLDNYTYKDDKPLDVNRRSCKGIIQFNNKLFEECNKLLVDQLGQQYSSPLQQAYADVQQKWIDSNEGGYVRITNVLYDTDETASEAMCREVAALIYELRQQGIADHDIAILTRNNHHITSIVDYMACHHDDIHIFSADAYLLEASTAVGMIINAMRYIADTQHQHALAHLAIDYHSYVLSSPLTPSDILEMRADSYGLPKDFVEHIPHLQQTPIYELAETLYRTFSLHLLSGEDGYMMAFFDRLLTWCSDTTGNLSDFIRYWDDELHATAIPAGASEGIEAMTIHKSKGLEFNTVILPYCEWELNKYESTLWVDTTDPIAQGLATIPVRYSKKMQDSIFAPQHEEEYLQQVVDSYNLLYVACTRPKENLFILKGAGMADNTKQTDEKKKKTTSTNTNNGTINTIAQLIGRAISMGDNDMVEYGTLATHSQKETATPEKRETEKQVNPFEVKPAPVEVAMHSEPLTVNFRQSNLSKRFVSSGAAPTNSYLDQGLLLHELFSRMSTADDAPTAIAALADQGLIGDDAQQREISRIVHRALKHTQAADWFSGKYQLFNECSIVYIPNTMPHGSLCYSPSTEPHTLRPDRVMRHGDHTIVVDFKFARPTDEHLKQVARYMELLRNMGHSHVEGYVWYVYENKTEKV